MVRKLRIIAKNVGERCIAVLALERGGAVEHFINQYAQSPPIDCARMATALDHFWRDVLFCAHKGVCPKIRDARFRVNGGQ